MATTIDSTTIRKVVELTFNTYDCPSCGVLYALESDFEKWRRKDGQTFYCPNGHSIGFGKSEADLLRERLAARDETIARKDAERDGLLDTMRTLERSRAAVQGELTKVKKRVAAGVCPECNRRFVKLADHMRSKHGTAEDPAAVAHEHGAGTTKGTDA